MGVPIVLGIINRLIVYVHVGQLVNGAVTVLALDDYNYAAATLDERVKELKCSGAIILYDGPPQEQSCPTK